MFASRYAWYALASALLFGASTPAAKLVLGTVSPLGVAALLYLGAAGALGTAWGLRARVRSAAREAPLRRGDLPWLAGATACGGIVGPVALFAGLARTDAAFASLILNFEGAFTALLAWLAYREHASRETVAGMGLIAAGGAVLAWQGGAGRPSAATGLLLLACLAWALDNNLTRRLSARDPVVVTALKTGAAGVASAALFFATGGRLPDAAIVMLAAFIGALGYGASLVLFVVSLRHLGTARTSAYFSSAPFAGAAIAIPLTHAPLSWSLWTGGALMAAGVGLHLRERHEHVHRHEAMRHEHAHVHDAHHAHEHEHERAQPVDPRQPHSHAHDHLPLVHVHPHYPDLHHRGHQHEPEGHA